MADAQAHGTAVPPIHRPTLLIPAALGAPPSHPAELWDDARVGRKYDASPDYWTSPRPMPVVQLACACGWRSPVLETPEGTRASDPTARTQQRVSVVLTSADFVARCELEWTVHLADGADHA